MSGGLHMCKGGQCNKISMSQSGQLPCCKGPTTAAKCAWFTWRAGIEHCVCINTLYERPVHLMSPELQDKPFQTCTQHNQIKAYIKKNSKRKRIYGHSLKENKALLHNKQVQQLHTCLGGEKQKT